MKLALASASKKHNHDELTGVMRLYSSETERIILANIYGDAEFSKRVLPQLDAQLFTVEEYRRAFQHAADAVEKGHEHGLAGAYRYCLDLGKTPEELGLPQLGSLAFDEPVRLADPAKWIAALRKKASEREAWRIAERMRLAIESGGGDTLEQLATAREDLRKLERELEPGAQSTGTIGDTVSRIGVDALLAEPRGVIASPWPQLTELVNGGPRPGELWIVAARPSVGKTTVALQWALNAARLGHKTLFLSLEMAVSDLMKRLLASEGNIPHGQLVRGNLDSAWRLRVAETLDRIGEYPLDVNDKIRTLGAIIAKIAAGVNVGLVVVDYLGLIENQGARWENRNQELSLISRRLKIAAMDHGVPILAAHQLNRAMETESRKPQLSDLRDSGSIEQDADVVLLLDSPANRKQRTEAPRDAVDVTVGKQRNGCRGLTVNLRLEGTYCRLVEAAERMPE